jgi:hypothetical protein
MYLSHNIVQRIVRLEQAVRTLEENADYTAKDKAEYAEKNRVRILFYIVNDIGIELNLKDADKLFDEKQVVTQDFRGQLIENIKSTLELVEQVGDNSELPVSVALLQEVNKTLAQDIVEDWQLNYRAAGEPFALVYEELTKGINPNTQLNEGSNNSYSTLVGGLLDKYNENNQQNRFYKLSQLAYELISLHPFITLNAYSIVFIVQLLLIRTVGQENCFANLAENFTQRKQDILEILKDSDPARREVNWHEMFLKDFAIQYEKNISHLKEAKQQESQATNKPFLDLNRRQLKILKYLQTIPTVKREDYVQMMDVSTMTAYRDLQVLVKHKLVKPIGVGRGTKYTLYSR